MKISQEQNKHYDYIFAGGGCAALSLAWYMNKAGLLKDKTALIIDREVKNSNNRTWAFWTKEAIAFDEIVFKKWKQIDFIDSQKRKNISLDPYSYQLIRGIDFYEFVLADLSKNSNIHFTQTEIKTIEEKKAAKPIVHVAHESFSTDWVFDSRFNKTEVSSALYLKQHFKGWIIETANPVFNPELPVLFDFNTPQKNLMRFIYILPFSPTRALVEYTLFSENLLSENEYDAAIKEYIDKVLKLEKYEILETEMGEIPMTNHKFSVQSSDRVLNIGTKGGRSKASTGYTFLRIQKQALAICKSIEIFGHPKPETQNNSKYHLFDSMMLQVLKDRGDLGEAVFSRLFFKNPIDRLFRFLDEESSLADDLRIMSSVPSLPFIKAFFKLKF